MDDGMKKWVVVIMQFIALAGASFGICSEPKKPMCSEYFQSTAVFTGVVLHEKYVSARGDQDDGWVYKIRPAKKFRGKVSNPVEVFTSNTDLRLHLKVGETYLFLATDYGRGYLEVTDCGNSGLLRTRRAEVEAIENLIRHPGSTGLIKGSVAKKNQNGQLVIPVPDVLVEISGTRKYSARTDKSGKFKIPLAPGQYQVHIESRDWLIEPSSLNYADPQDIAIEAGSCADLLFKAEPRR